MKRKGATMSQSYQVATPKDSAALSDFLVQQGQFLLPMLELIEQSRLSVDEVIDVASRATLEAVLTLAAQQIAGPHPGRRG
jgi:hypothetical protein